MHPVAPTTTSSGATKADFYVELLTQLQALIEGQRNWVSNTSNASALIYHALLARQETLVNWVGFYVKNNAEEELILGPFQGEVACVIIPPGRGVCGAAAKRRATVGCRFDGRTSWAQLVPNVHEFPGHIACSSKTNSEIVVPMVKSDGSLIGVLDLDAINLNGFDADDQQGLEKLAQCLIDGSDWPQW